ncbi:MAG: ABC transporter ATP-binding protein [Flavobacteriales bacterium]|jgi:lipoprotein-releasing system ATP-binding protein|nr:ABC transporter ATP-binding protein [Flavobacteriales bacterium]
MITLKDIYKSYQNTSVLRGVNLTINQGEVLSIMGASGAGKTTLLQVLGTLDKFDAGEIWFNKMNIKNLKKNDLAKFRNQNIGFIFQFHNLLPEFSALENIAMPAWIKGDTRTVSTQKAIDLLKRLKLESKRHKKPSELSGGEQQRIAVARALVNQPQIILADEPSGNLDSQNAQDLHELFMEFKEENKQSFVVVTHNEQLSKISDRQLYMKDGIFIEDTVLR